MSINLLISKRDELAAQLAAHDAMLADARKAERDECIAKLKSMMADHGITAADLGNKPARKPAKLRTAKAAAQPVRYQFGAVGYVTGRPGKPPAAYTAAKASGTLDVYRVAEVA